MKAKSTSKAMDNPSSLKAHPHTMLKKHKNLENCELFVDSSRKNSCVNQLNSQLQKDGYINTRVVAEEINGQVKLIIIPGRLVEINVNSKNEGLAREIKDKLAPLLDQIFNIIQIKNALLDLERLGIVSSLSGSIGKLGSNPTKATLNITAEVTPKP